MSQRISDEQRLEVVRQLRVAHPGLDVESMIVGSLAGPASANRPPVPVWEYLSYQTDHPEISLEEIEQIRFPVTLQGGETMVTSISEMTHIEGPVRPTYAITVPDVVRLYELMHVHGAIIWIANTRTHEEVLPTAVYRAPIFEQWRRELQSSAQG